MPHKYKDFANKTQSKTELSQYIHWKDSMIIRIQFTYRILRNIYFPCYYIFSLTLKKNPLKCPNSGFVNQFCKLRILIKCWVIYSEYWSHLGEMAVGHHQREAKLISADMSQIRTYDLGVPSTCSNHCSIRARIFMEHTQDI